MLISVKQLVAWVQRGGGGMITALSEDTGFICNVNQESFLWDFYNHYNVSVTLL